MLQEGNYNVLEFYPPAQGMNRKFAPEVLPQDFAVMLENILPTPLGAAMVRYGTKRLPGMNLDPDAVILETFPHVQANGDRQMVLYVQTFKQDTSAKSFKVLSPQSFSFKTTYPELFACDTQIKIPYTSRGITTLYAGIVSKTTLGETVTITVADNSFPLSIQDMPIQGVKLNGIYFSQGSLYVYDLKTHTLSDPLKTGLSVACVPRSVTFLNTLLICNGVDKVLAWDGTHLSEVVDFVKEDTAVTFNRIHDQSFSFTLSPDKAEVFAIAKYQNRNQIQLKISGVTTTLTVTNITRLENLITITTAEILPAFANQLAQPPELFYRDWPPAFSFMMVAHNRLWALGKGAVGLSYRDPDQALRVYFTQTSNSLSNWFNPTTKTVPSINLAEGHGCPDNLEAIACVGGLMVLMGRSKTQVWTGSEPLGAAIDPTRPKFEFLSIMPIGIVHGNLVVEMANDVYFVSPHGLLSFSTLNVAKQFAATANEAVDPLVRQFVTSTLNSNQAYRSCRSFKYQSGAFCGFKIGLNKVLVSLYATNLYAWSLFSGDFAKAQTFLATLDNALYLLIGNQIYQYADGTIGGIQDTPSTYGDNHGQDLINFLWTLPIVHLSGKRFANKRYEIHLDYPSSLVIDGKSTLCLMIDGDLPKTFMLQDTYNLQLKGDSLAVVPFVSPHDIGNDPNQPNLQGLGFRLDEPYAFPKGRLKFVSSSFTVSLAGAVASGPVVLKKIRLFGIAERST